MSSCRGACASGVFLPYSHPFLRSAISFMALGMSIPWGQRGTHFPQAMQLSARSRLFKAR